MLHIGCTRAAQRRSLGGMRAIHFRVSDAIYGRIQEEAEADRVSVAQFAREATIARAAIWAARRGMRWADAGAWEGVIAATSAIDDHDIQARAAAARATRQGTRT